MARRYVCLICRNEIVRPSAECPYCKSRSMIAEGASPRVLALVFAVMVLTFALTAFYTQAFNNGSRERGIQHFEAAEHLMEAGDYDAAIGEYRDALLYARGDTTYRLGLARALYEANRHSEAETHLSELRAADPTSGIVNSLLARLAAWDSRIDEAVSYYRTAIHGDWDAAAPDTRLQLRLELVGLLDGNGRDQQLTAELLELLEIAPRNADIKFRLASLLLKTGVYDRASSLFRELVAADPRNREALLGRAEAEFQLSNFLTARTHYNRAQLYGDSPETRQRIQLCNRIIELDPTRRGIELRERFRRSRVLLERALATAEQCRNPEGEAAVGPSRTLPPASEETLGHAREVLGDRRQRSSADAVEANIQLAAAVWAASRPLCDPAAEQDEALQLVLAKLNR